MPEIKKIFVNCVLDNRFWSYGKPKGVAHRLPYGVIEGVGLWRAPGRMCDVGIDKRGELCYIVWVKSRDEDTRAAKTSQRGACMVKGPCCFSVRYHF